MPIFDSLYISFGIDTLSNAFEKSIYATYVSAQLSRLNVKSFKESIRLVQYVGGGVVNKM